MSRTGIFRARDLARLECEAFQLHDLKKYDESIQKFSELYSGIFLDVTQKDVRLAAKYYVDALKFKDLIDESSLDFEIRRGNPLWKKVRESFQRFCIKLRVSSDFAKHLTNCWINHKVGGDYITECFLAQQIFVKRLLRNKNWYKKLKDGQNGPGPLPVLYLAGIECHDLHTPEAWKLAEDCMALYYKILLSLGGQ